MPTIEELIQSWDGLAVVTTFDSQTETWIFVCMHDNRLGAATGGSRMKIYDSHAEGLLDAMRLAEGMTHKWAAVGLPFGGGKAVLSLTRSLAEDERKDLFARYGKLVESLRGAFRTGEDLGTSSSDMLVLSRYTRYVHGFDSRGQKIDPSPFTAHGVLSGIRAALDVAFGTSDFEGRTVLVEGVGNVGSRLAQSLADGGAVVLLADLDRDRALDVAERIGGRVIAPGDVPTTKCDVYAPCAVGATINAETVPRLRCRIVAGSANNQLRDSADADELHHRNVMYVPDFIINAGGAMAFAQIDRGLDSAEEILPFIDGIGLTVRSILDEAASRSEPPLVAARRRVAETLARTAGEPPTALAD